MKTLYTVTATTTGGHDRNVRTDDGVLDLELNKGEEKTIAEQLFAAGYSASFFNALQEVAKEHKVAMEDASVTASVDLGETEEGDREMSVNLDVYIPGVDIETGEEMINEAHEICTYSWATRDNIDITLNLMLDEDE
ncbi:Ohr family peroxiredoxin [Salinimicrobium flavum]|uniref:Ohr family peroxiredoxin n=1 Tax=Salinimicrobium flavum TaxID=1737065 RepID=A0ABW5IWF3_9FLAO